MARRTLAELRESATYVNGPTYTIDCTDDSAVVVCLQPGCDWRYVAHHRATALRKYATHCRASHDDERAAGRALARATGMEF